MTNCDALIVLQSGNHRAFDYILDHIVEIEKKNDYLRSYSKWACHRKIFYKEYKKTSLKKTKKKLISTWNSTVKILRKLDPNDDYITITKCATSNDKYKYKIIFLHF